MAELTGQIERITYTNEENGYTVARVSVEGRRDPATVVGILHDPAPGTVLRMRGEWTVHPKFGSQFKIEGYETVVPTSSDAIERYLAAGAVKGIGPVTAKQIVERFGAESLRVMDEEIGRLREVTGIGRKRLEGIRRSWDAQKGVREVMLFLEGNGVSPAYATRIYRRYGAATISVVRKNPYRLAGDIPGVGFVTADRIAASLGYPSDGDARLRSGILYTLERSTLEGHLYLPAGELLHRSAELLGCEEGRLTALLDELASTRAVAADRQGGEILDATPVYTRRLYDCEVAVARRLRALLAAPPADRRRVEAGRPPKAPGPRPAGAAGEGRTLAAGQREAVRAALENGVSVITGGPGTGKTTVIDALARELAEGGGRVALAAPTGRAAKRMSEATGREAKTIHRLLEVEPGGGGFRRNEANPLDCDALILDEISMVDVPLMAALLAALRDSAHLVMVGDADQLPSVGPGNLLADLIDSGVIPTVRLTEIFRQERDSGIVAGAYAIIHGKRPAFAQGGEGDLYHIEQEEPERVVALIVALLRDRIPRRFGLDPLEEIQVLTPMNRGPTGTVRLNETLQEALNPGGPELVRGSRSFRRGDKVMQTRNNYSLDVFNGDIGRVSRVDSESGELSVLFDGEEVRYGAEELDELSLAYAVTVHKAQGSEFPAVVIPLLGEHYLLLQRNLLYTAVTRGKRLVVLVGTSKALSTAIANDRTQRRNTRLASRLADAEPIANA